MTPSQKLGEKREVRKPLKIKRPQFNLIIMIKDNLNTNRKFYIYQGISKVINLFTDSFWNLPKINGKDGELICDIILMRRKICVALK